MPGVNHFAKVTFLALTFSLETALTLTTPAALAAGPSCTLPGVTVFNDPAGDTEDGLAAHDLRSLSIAEPAGLADQLVFTVKVSDLSLLPPNTEWKVDFRIYELYANHFVAMNTFNPVRGAVYTYGHYQCTSAVCQTVTDGEADAGEYLPDGTIRITVARSRFPGLQPGRTIGAFYTHVQTFYNPTIGTIKDMDYNFTATDYTLVGNASCLQAVQPPAAPTNLAATSPNSSSPNKREAVLTWDDNAADEQFYHVERSASPTEGFVEVGTAPADATSYHDQTVAAKTTYYYRVRAGNAGGFSEYSNTVGVSVK